MLGNLSGGEILILLVIVLLVFGANRLPEAGRAVGKGMREFRRALNEARDAAMDALPPDLRVREITAITMVVESATAHPQEPPSLDEARAIYTVLLRNLVNVFGDDTKYLIHTDLDPSRTCAYRNAVLKSVLGLGAHDRSVLLRAMMLGQLS